MDAAFGAEPTPSDPPPSPDPVPSEPSAPPVSQDAAPAAGTPTPPATPPEPEAPSPTGETPPTPTPEPPPAPTPFTFRVDGREVTPNGAFVQPDGTITFQPEAWRTFQQQHVADRNVWRQKELQYRQAVQQAQATKTAEQAKAEAVLSAITAAAEQGDDAVADLVLGFRANLPKLKAEAEARHYREQLERQQQASAPEMARQQWETWREDRENALDEVVQWATQQPEWTVLGTQTDAIRKQLTELSEAGRLWTQDADGQWRIDAPTFKWFMGVQADAARVRTEAEQAKAAAEIVKRNQAALTPKVTAPPVPSATPPARTPAPASSAASTAKDRWQRFKESTDF